MATSLNNSMHLRHVVVLVVLVACLSYLQGTDGCFGAFSHSCNGETLIGSVLQANCNNGNGGYDTSSINLDDHITNYNGNLQCNSGGGGFSGSCQNAGVGGSELGADCHNNAGTRLHSTVDLNLCIANRHGYLGWTCV